MRFTIRDLLWLMVVAALAVAILVNNYRHRQQIGTMNEQAEQLRKDGKVWESRARSLRNDVMTGSNKNTEVEFIPDGIYYKLKPSN
jgi:hypothetical protein